VTPHDEFALVVDGDVVIELLDPTSPLVEPTESGSRAVEGNPRERSWALSMPVTAT